jgi:hypothetical protein
MSGKPTTSIDDINNTMKAAKELPDLIDLLELYIRKNLLTESPLELKKDISNLGRAKNF